MLPPSLDTSSWATEVTGVRDLANWNDSKERVKAFWERELVDRCCVCITAPKDGCGPEAPTPTATAEDRLRYWTDGECILKRKLAHFERTIYLGEATPMIPLDLGTAGHAGYFKRIRYQFEGTVWFFPFLEDWDKDRLEFDSESFLYKKTLELARYLSAESRGRYFVAMPDVSGNLDALAHLRGSEKVLLDLYEEQDRVHAVLRELQEVWTRIYDEVYRIVRPTNQGGSSVEWLDVWAPGKLVQIQSDMSVMISPDMFDEFVLPELEAQCEWADYPLYHLDGQEQIRHLDSLLSVRKLRTIQWTCVEGQPSPLAFLPHLKRIQAAGKGLLIRIRPEELEPIMEQLSSRGLYLLVQASSEEEARHLLRRAEALTHE
jgi:hypothetical protein